MLDVHKAMPMTFQGEACLYVLMNAEGEQAYKGEKRFSSVQLFQHSPLAGRC